MLTIEEIILEECRRLPPLPQSVSQLMALFQRDHTIDEVVKVVQIDAAVTANLLKVVNSAAMGLNRTISSPAQAVTYLGDKMVMGIAIAGSSGPIFEGRLEGYGGDAGALWGHDLYTAIVAREIANRSAASVNPEIAFTAGIVHDIGKAVISQYLKTLSTKPVFDVADKERPDFLAAERDKLGTDHCQVGGVLAFKWRLPAALKESIQFHHDPRQASEEHRSLAYVVHVADRVAMQAGQSTGADCLQYPLDPDFTERLGITQDEFDPLMARVEREFARVVGGMFAKE
jgi:HD-like signal output (HDOD) protein